jgi:hypothetical protein
MEKNIQMVQISADELTQLKAENERLKANLYFCEFAMVVLIVFLIFISLTTNP